MALTLTELFEKPYDPVFRSMVAAACWRHAKTLLAKATPTTEELKLASRLLSDNGSGGAIGRFVIVAAVLIDDATDDDAAVENAVNTAATKLVTLEI